MQVFLCSVIMPTSRVRKQCLYPCLHEANVFRFCFYFSSFSLIRAQNQSEPPVKAADLPKQTDKENHVTRVAWTCGKCLDCSSLVQKFRTIHGSIRKRIALWCEFINSKFQEILQRCKTLWKSKWPSGKVYDG